MLKSLQYMTEPELAELMTASAKAVERAFFDRGVEKPRLAIVVFNDPQVGQYISNCRRSDMIAALRECADRIERNQDVERGDDG